MTEKHIHDCTGPGMTCPCGFVLSPPPPICVSFEVFDGDKVLVSDGFNCSDLCVAAQALRDAAEKLDDIDDARWRNR